MNLVISLGPDPATQPPPVVDPPAPEQVTKTVTLDLSEFEGMVNVRVLMDSEQVFNENYDVTMEPWVDVVVTGTGSKELAVYVNGVLYRTIPVDFSAP